MRVFISYDQKDEAIAHLIAHILRQNKFDCLIDRAVKAGLKIDIALQEMIRTTDVVLVLLTNNSVSSAWVNQEVGFALAYNKTVWPLAMEENLLPEGMLATTKSYSLFDWTDPDRTISSLISELSGAKEGGQDPEHYKRLGLDRVITGKIERTEFIIEQLQRLLNENAKPISVYAQAAFSTFAISDDPMYKEAGKHSDEYMHMLLEEKRLLKKLIQRPETSFKILLWPVRAYEEKYLAIRYKTLLEWMNEIKELSNIQYLCAQYLGPNRFIVKDEFCIEGYKLHHTSGYEMNVVKYQQSKIDDSINAFMHIYNKSSDVGETKDTAITQIRSMYNNMSQLSKSINHTKQV